MALPKNSVYCPACHRTKILFETQAKADNFIKFNSEEILRNSWRTHKAPVRSYYCQLCGGFHVTSNPSAEDGKRIDEHINERIEIAKKFEEDSKKPCTARRDGSFGAERQDFSLKLERARNFIRFGQTAKAEPLLKNCEEIRIRLRQQDHDVSYFTQKLDDARGLFSIAVTVNAMSDEQLAQTLELPQKDSMAKIAHNVLCVRTVEAIIANNEQLCAKGEYTAMRQGITNCRSLLKTINFTDMRCVKEVFGATLKKQEDQIAAHNERDRKRLALAKMEADMKLYRATLIKVINKMGGLETLFNNGDYYNCRIGMEECYKALKKLNATDDNTNLIRQHLDYWKEQIEMRAESVSCA